MPKLARQEYYYSERNLSVVYSRAKNPILQNKIPKHPSKRKRNPIRFAISCLVFAGILGFAMPFSFNKITKGFFNPIPYGDMRGTVKELTFSSRDYLSNAWFMGERLFSYAKEGKSAQMIEIPENVNMPVLKSNLLNLMKEYGTISPAIYVWDYDTQNYISINGDKIYSAASIIKVPVLIDLFQSIESGQINLEDTMPLTEYFRSEGSGHLQFKAENSRYTIDSLARVMITDSDNSATNMLMAKIGSMTDVNRAIRDWGLKNTEVHTWLPDLGGTNYTTAKDMASMLYNIDENDKLLTPYSRNKIFSYMGNVHNNRLIEAGLGKGAKFLHKTGDIGKMLGDAGIVTTPNGKKYIVVILANRPHNSYLGKEFIIKASEVIYNYMVH